MNWKKLIYDLLVTGLSQEELGGLIGKSQAWVSAVLQGRYLDIKWSDGEALRALHTERCPSAAEHQKAA